MTNFRSAAAASAVLVFAGAARASHTPAPTLVVVPGSLQSELGCPGDWQPECAATRARLRRRRRRVAADVHRPRRRAGSTRPRSTAPGTRTTARTPRRNGANIALNLGAATAVKFYYSHETHWIADNVNKVIAVAPGSFQSELGLSRRLAAGLPALLAPGPGRRRHLHLPHERAARGRLRGEGRHRRELGRELRRGRRRRTAPTSRSPWPPTARRCVFTYDPKTHVLTVSAGRRRRPQPIFGDDRRAASSRELGCPGDWQPDCAATHLTFDATDERLAGRRFDIPAGSWEYKAAINDAWDENYGANATLQRPEHPARTSPRPRRSSSTTRTQTHWVTDNRNKVIAVAPGSFQSELGCPATGSRTACAPGSRTRTATASTPSAPRALPAGELRGEGRHQRELGRELRRRRRPQRRQHPVHRARRLRRDRSSPTTRRPTC